MNEIERLVDLKLQLREISKQILDLQDNDEDNELTALTAKRKAIEKEISIQQKILRLQQPSKSDKPILWLADSSFTS